MNALRKKIIHVDDATFYLLTIKENLKEYYEVYPAQSAQKLFETLEHVTPDLILLDANMPEMDGFEVISILKADERYADIPVVFLTAQRDRESVVKGASLGAVAHVGKPFKSSSLLETIEKALAPKSSADSTKDECGDCEGRPSVLAVDDVSNMLWTIHAALRDRYKVYTLSKPEELRTFLSKKRPDMFLLDYYMPGMTGLDLIPIIREFPEHKETPIIMLTSAGTTKHVISSKVLGACDYILKPFSTKELLEKVGKHIKKQCEE